MIIEFKKKKQNMKLYILLEEWCKEKVYDDTFFSFRTYIEDQQLFYESFLKESFNLMEIHDT